MSCEYKVGEKVYVKNVPIGNYGSVIPTELINKRFTILSITQIPLNDSNELWDIELDGCTYCLTNKNISRTKPF